MIKKEDKQNFSLQGDGINFDDPLNPSNSIELATNPYKKDAVCTVPGFGYTNDDDQEYPSQLLFTEITMWNSQKCKRETNPKYTYDETMICGSNGNGANPCGKDSGSPLICKDPNDRRTKLYVILL